MARESAAFVAVQVLERVAHAARPGVLLRQLLRSFRRRRARRLAEGRGPYQVPLRILQPAPPSGRLFEWDLVRCDHFSCTLPARQCVMRQEARWPGGNRRGDGTVVPKRAGVHGYCSSGVCDQGAEYRTRLVGFEPPRHSFYRDDSRAQHRARRMVYLSNPGSTDDTWSTRAELALVVSGAVTVQSREDT
jgi:hypothetical protein